MTNDTIRARELLRIALELLDNEGALVAAAMISGAINVLDGAAEPAATLSGTRSGRLMRTRTAANDCRSCA
ncbi:hypothetical protein [Novosphingobium resinovorum]|uniref:hypothetical protein n=1 Tax=Novosphingobium resinovorum TaxID=158500 RepID=UPI002ED3FDB1|nr:hypothetical protein [Novosphingobium resinovorum]